MKKVEERKPSAPADEQSVWKARYDRQTLLIDSIVSLLNKYGRSLELEMLYREFLLTLMGQFLVQSACFFHYDEETSSYVIASHYGPGCADDAPAFAADSALVAHLRTNPRPVRTSDVPQTVMQDAPAAALAQMTSLLSPLVLKDRLIGFLGLGPRITQQPFADGDLDIIGTLCAVSAVSFNNARLFENARVSMEEIQRLYDLRTEMISRVTHEFRTPLTVITAGLQVMDVSEDSRPIRDSVDAAVSDLERLIGSMLELRGDATVARNDKRFHPGKALSELLPAMSAAADKSISFQVADHARGSVQLRNVGRESLISVASALLENAVKFSDDGATVRLELGITGALGSSETDGTRIQDWEEQTQATIEGYDVMAGGDDTTAGSPSARAVPCLVLRVADTGIGIPQDEMKFLGEPFRQASNSPDQRVKGKALGLAVALKTLSECGGELWCRSEEGAGTTFTVYLPLAASSVAGGAA